MYWLSIISGLGLVGACLPCQLAQLSQLWPGLPLEQISSSFKTWASISVASESQAYGLVCGSGQANKPIVVDQTSGHCKTEGAGLVAKAFTFGGSFQWSSSGQVVSCAQEGGPILLRTLKDTPPSNIISGWSSDTASSSLHFEGYALYLCSSTLCAYPAQSKAPADCQATDLQRAAIGPGIELPPTTAPLAPLQNSRNEGLATDQVGQAIGQTGEGSAQTAMGGFGSANGSAQAAAQAAIQEAAQKAAQEVAQKAAQEGTQEAAQASAQAAAQASAQAAAQASAQAAAQASAQAAAQGSAQGSAQAAALAAASGSAQGSAQAAAQASAGIQTTAGIGSTLPAPAGGSFDSGMSSDNETTIGDSDQFPDQAAAANWGSASNQTDESSTGGEQSSSSSGSLGFESSGTSESSFDESPSDSGSESTSSVVTLAGSGDLSESGSVNTRAVGNRTSYDSISKGKSIGVKSSINGGARIQEEGIMGWIPLLFALAFIV